MVAGQAPGMQRRRQVVNQTLNEEIRQQTTLGLNNGQRARLPSMEPKYDPVLYLLAVTAAASAFFVLCTLM